jgi:4-carboxymuconolactone decarboxylase
VSDPHTRRERGLEVLSRLSGSEEGGQGLVGFLDSLGAVGHMAIQTGAGEVWSRTQISRRDRSLVVISMLTALGRELELHQHIPGGLHHGLARDEIDEIMVQVGVYAGLPFALAGAGIAAKVFAELDGTEQRAIPAAPAESKDDEKRREDGKEVLRTLLGMPTGTDMEFAATATVEQLGDMGELVLDYAFGDVWSRPQLSRRDRSLVVISVLTALSLPNELEIHLRGALHHGVTRDEIEEVMVTAVVYGGFPRAIDGIHLARKVFAAADSST